MENKNDINTQIGLISSKIQGLDILKKSNENNGGCRKSTQSHIQRSEKFENSEATEAFTGEKYDIVHDTEKRNIVVTDVKRYVHIFEDKDGAENIGNVDRELIKKIEDTDFPRKQESNEFTFEKGDELSIEKGDASSNGEKDIMDNNKTDIFEREVELTFENGDANGIGVKNYPEGDKKELFKENLQNGDVLDHSGKKCFDDIKREGCEKKEAALCTESGSDSKISTSSNEKANSSYSGNSKSSSRYEDQNTKESLRIPSDALVAKIVRQAEFYFSDFNLLKNNFLLKHVRRNKEGFVSLKLVASFRKIKSLTKDWRVVAYSLQSSKLLELNSEKSKIRRIEPIPKVEETSLGKTVVVFNLPFPNPSSEELKEMFSKFGNIVKAEIMSPKSENYNTYYKRCRYHNEEIASTVFGSIEFEKFEDAVSAIKDEESHLPKENKMKVVALMPQIQRSKRRNAMFNQYNQHPRRGNGRFKARYEYQSDQMVNGGVFLEDYRYARPVLSEKQYRRFYRGGYQKGMQPSGSASEIPDKLYRDNYVASGEDLRNGYGRSRQLQMSNRMNINRQFTPHQPRYVEAQFGYREANFE